ncbi:VaFE repeat-containing surface-anchored protein [Corynebacterium singulare]|uniref:VaFE repeat-containing surface-anchored protein n=1 Tax=Corynebacterium singulare TaxID=161899 RepID=UPI000A80AF72|nr:VaFE repeat-containing surface-anchored protein [Corynebacterium singulare]
MIPTDTLSGPAQPVMPVDQPGLPDDGEGESEEPTTSPENPDTEENTTEETTSENPEGETSSSETTTDSEPSNTEETTPKDSTTEPTSPEETTTEDTGEPTPGKTTDVVPNPDPTPTTEKQEKDLNPKIETEASFDGDNQQVVAGATVIDTVSYEDLVPGKKYTLRAELRNKVADENGQYPIVGRGELVDFIPDAESGKVEVKIDVDKQLETPIAAAVAYEYLYSHEVNADGKDAPNEEGDGNLIVTHDNINDGNQTVYTKWSPEIGTVAKLAEGNRVVEGATVIDTVTYEDLVPGKNYTLKAKLISKADGTTVLGEATHSFTAEKSAGSEDVVITVNDKAKNAVGAAVAFEKLFSAEVDADGKDISNSGEEVEIAKHENINDRKQTVDTTEWTPSIETKADLGGATQVSAGAVVKDTVKFTDLVPGKEYTLKAQLRNKAADDKGEHAVIGEGSKNFTPKTSAGEVVVDIKVDDNFKGVVASAVAFEKLFSKQVDESGKDAPNEERDGNLITTHEDIDDGDQTVNTTEWNPSIGTKASKAEGTDIEAGTVVTDTVTYTDLVPGKEYTLRAELRSKVKDEVTGEYPVIGRGEKTFIPTESFGDEEVEITVLPEVTGAVKEAVAFEYLTSTVVDKNGNETTTGESNDIAEHTNINDREQTVKSDKPDETPSTETSETTTSENPGEECTTTTEPTQQTTEPTQQTTEPQEQTTEPTQPQEQQTTEPASSTESTTPVNPCGPGESETPKTSETSSKTTVTTTKSESSVTSSKSSESSSSESSSSSSSSESEEPSEEPSDEPSKPSGPGDEPGEKKNAIVSTNADFDGGLRVVVGGAKIVDQVSYEGLVPGKEYFLDAKLISKADGKSVLGETTGHKFVPTEPNGTEAVTIVVDEKVTEPVEAAVAFEKLTSKQVNDKGEETPGNETPNEIGKHEDITDDDQTVTTKDELPRISTNADFANGATEVVAGAVVEDTVSFNNLVPGKNYTLKAELISKADGETVVGDGQLTFAPETANGEAVVEITVDENLEGVVEAAVAFEELTSVEVDKLGQDTPDASEDEPNFIADHKDINDKDQTVPKETETPETTTSEKPGEECSTTTEPTQPQDQTTEPTQPQDQTTEPTQPQDQETTESTTTPVNPCGPGESETPKTSETSSKTTVTTTKSESSVTSSKSSESSSSESSSSSSSSESEEPSEEPSDEPSKPSGPGDEPGEKKNAIVSTNADFDGGLRVVVGGAKIVDQVSYEGLVPGKEYFLDAKLISKADGKSVLGETTGHKFVPTEPNGTEAVTIVVDEKVTEPVEAAVAFEKLTSKQVNDKGEETPGNETPNEIGKHEDITDDDQTVTTKDELPRISTNADFANGATEVVAGAVVEDTVSFNNLVPGKTYTLKAELISKADGETVVGDGQLTFAPETANGEAVVEITVDENLEGVVEAAVAFEELTSVEVDKLGQDTPDASEDEPNFIADHKDINDKDQTVPKETETTPNKPGEETTPNKPGEETTPNKPGEETTPNKPGEETTPNKPGEETTPNKPGEETTPNKPGEETTPNKPGEETTPNKPGEETTPNKPGEETTPNKPGEETTPNKPGDKPGDEDGSSKKSDLPWWLLLIPGLGLIKLIIDGGNGGNGGDHDGGKGTSEVIEDNDRGDNRGESTGDNAGESSEETGENTGRDDREVVVLDATPPEDAGMPLPSNAERVEIKHVPSGATKLEPGMKDFIK